MKKQSMFYTETYFVFINKLLCLYHRKHTPNPCEGSAEANGLSHWQESWRNYAILGQNHHCLWGLSPQGRQHRRRRAPRNPLARHVFVCVLKNDRVLAEVGRDRCRIRAVASDADCRNAESPRRRQIKPVVGIGIRVWRQGICNAKEIAVAACRVRISLVGNSVIIPIVGVDAAADCLDIV